jgi:hypothetical protein
MKILSAFILTALLAFAGCLFLPWWIISVVAFVVALLIPIRPGAAFLAAFVAIFLLWGVQAFYIDSINDHVLASRVVSVLKLGSSSLNLVLATAFIGGLVAGLSALTGSLLRVLIFDRTRRERHVQVTTLP